MYGKYAMRYWRKQWAESRKARNRGMCEYLGRKYYRSEMRESARKYATARWGA